MTAAVAAFLAGAQPQAKKKAARCRAA